MPVQTYCDWNAVATAVTAALHDEGESPLPVGYNAIISKCTGYAADDIEQAFIPKGYTPQQLAQSSSSRTWNERLATYLALCELAGLGKYNKDNINDALDCRKEFKEIANQQALIVNGQVIAPTANAGPVGGVSYGQVGAVTRMLRGRCGCCRQWPCCCRGGRW